MLKNDIGINAGTIWVLLEKHGRLSIREIGELTGYKEMLIVLSLGWLARENKITFLETEGGMAIELSHTSPEMFY